MSCVYNVIVCIRVLGHMSINNVYCSLHVCKFDLGCILNLTYLKLTCIASTQLSDCSYIFS